MVAAGQDEWLRITILSESLNCRKNGFAKLAFLCILPYALPVWEYSPMLISVRSVYPCIRRTRMVTAGASARTPDPYTVGNA